MVSVHMQNHCAAVFLSLADMRAIMQGITQIEVCADSMLLHSQLICIGMP